MTSQFSHCPVGSLRHHARAAPLRRLAVVIVFGKFCGSPPSP